MSFADLRHTEVYENALRTPSILWVWPAPTLWKRDRHRYHDIQVEHAGYRLDHIVRRALDPTWNRPAPWRITVLKYFVEAIDEKMKSVTLQESTKSFINPRLDFCREVLKQADEAFRDTGCDLSSDSFRQFVITHDSSAEDIVFNNPFYLVGKEWPRLLGQARSEFLREIERHWN
jgi:hypothetical protein